MDSVALEEISEGEVGFRGLIDPEYDNYKTFFDHALYQRLMTASEKTPIEWPVFDLFINWRGLANTHAMPWILIESLSRFWDGAFKVNDKMGFAHRLAIMMRDNVVKECNFTNMQKKKVTATMEAICQRYVTAMEHDEPPQFDKDKIWNEDCKEMEFRFAIIGSQRCVFGSLYHYYENFLRQIIGVLKGDPDYKIPRRKEFIADVRQYLGDEVAEKCVIDHDVNLARLVRNSLAHTGGHVTQELKDANHPFPVVDGRIQIMAAFTKQSFEILKRRATLIIIVALEKLGKPMEPTL